MHRYTVSRFDGETFVVVDQIESREICICTDYETGSDAGKRARRIANLLNGQAEAGTHGSLDRPGRRKR